MEAKSAKKNMYTHALHKHIMYGATIGFPLLLSLAVDRSYNLNNLPAIKMWSSTDNFNNMKYLNIFLPTVYFWVMMHEMSRDSWKVTLGEKSNERDIIM